MSSNWQKNNKEHVKEVRRIYNRTLAGRILCSNQAKRGRYKTRLTLLNMLGGECVRCGYRDIRALQFDHKNGKGKIDRKRFSCGDAMFRHYRRNPIEANSTLQVLCANCNWIKVIENKESVGKPKRCMQ